MTRYNDEEKPKTRNNDGESVKQRWWKRETTMVKTQNNDGENTKLRWQKRETMNEN
jgi:hypothetical protein